METNFWLLAGLAGIAALALVARSSSQRRRRRSIRGMLDASRPCAVRTRG